VARGYCLERGSALDRVLAPWGCSLHGMMTVLGLHWAYLPASRGKTEQFQSRTQCIPQWFGRTLRSSSERPLSKVLFGHVMMYAAGGIWGRQFVAGCPHYIYCTHLYASACHTLDHRPDSPSCPSPFLDCVTVSRREAQSRQCRRLLNGEPC
jgi:hypothetical protein